jgi:manganese/zinc/iron transport system substrate-binding protein
MLDISPDLYKNFDMPKLRILPLVILPLALALGACGGGEDASAGGPKPLRIVATTSIVADTASRIAGEHAKIEALMGPGVDPHLYKASESDVRRLAEADLILYNGLHLEGKMGDILTKMARSRPVVAVSEDIPPSLLREPPEFAGQYDPHVWFDVSMWKETLGPVTRELAKLDPAHAKDYEANAAAYARELDELDAWVKQQVGALPPGQRTLVTAHDAFGYFGRRYGMEVVGIQGISTLSEAGLNDMDRVVQVIVDKGVKAIFVESSVPRRSIEAVQAGVEAQGKKVAIGGQLHSDSLGAAGAPEGTYVGMVRANTNTIVNALK